MLPLAAERRERFMFSESDNPSKLAYSSRCVPGSAADIEEKERLAEFQRAKAARKVAEDTARPEVDAKRKQDYETATEAIKERMYRNKAARR